MPVHTTNQPTDPKKVINNIVYFCLFSVSHAPIISRYFSFFFLCFCSFSFISLFLSLLTNTKMGIKIAGVHRTSATMDGCENNWKNNKLWSFRMESEVTEMSSAQEGCAQFSFGRNLSSSSSATQSILAHRHTSCDPTQTFSISSISLQHICWLSRNCAADQFLAFFFLWFPIVPHASRYILR